MVAGEHVNGAFDHEGDVLDHLAREHRNSWTLRRKCRSCPSRLCSFIFKRLPSTLSQLVLLEASTQARITFLLYVPNQLPR